MTRAPETVRTGDRPTGAAACFFNLKGKRAIVAGGSDAAAWKVELLSAAGARVDVFAAIPGAPYSRSQSHRRMVPLVSIAAVGRQAICAALPLPSPIAPMTKRLRNLLPPHAARACRSTSSTGRPSAIFHSVRSSIARRLSLGFPPRALRRFSARQSAPRSKR